MLMTEPHANKNLGQHWLVDKASLEAIVSYLPTNLSKLTILEIGPGLGQLSDQLLKTSLTKLICVEVDEQLVEYLSPKYQNNQRITIIQQDIRRFDFAILADYLIVANIPYYLTSYLLRLITNLANKPQQMVLLVQQEVAINLVAKPGKLSLLALFVQNYFLVSYGFKVNKELFEPAPKVDSAVVNFKLRSRPIIPSTFEKAFSRLIRTSFASKRKTLINNLMLGYKLTKNQAVQLLAANQLKPTVRAQELSLTDWHNLLISLKTLNML